MAVFESVFGSCLAVSLISVECLFSLRGVADMCAEKVIENTLDGGEVEFVDVYVLLFLMCFDY